MSASVLSSVDVDGVVDGALSDVRHQLDSGALSEEAAQTSLRTLLTILRNIRDDVGRIKFRYIQRSKVAGKLGGFMPILTAADFADADGCGQLVQTQTDAALVTAVYEAVITRIADDKVFAAVLDTLKPSPPQSASADAANATFLSERLAQYTTERAYLLALQEARDEKQPQRDDEIADLFNEAWTDTSPYQIAAVTALYKLLVSAKADAAQLVPVETVLPTLNQCERIVRLSKLIGFVWSESFVSFPPNGDVSRIDTALAQFAPYIAAVQNRRIDGRKSRLDALEAKVKHKETRNATQNTQRTPPSTPPAQAERIRERFAAAEANVFRLRRMFGVAYRIEWTISLFSGKEYDDATIVTSEPVSVKDVESLKWRGIIIKRRAKGAAPSAIGLYIDCVSPIALKSTSVTLNMTASVLHRTARVPCARPFAPVMFLTQTVNAAASRWGFPYFITQQECAKIGAYNKDEDAITFRIDFALTHQTHSRTATPPASVTAISVPIDD